VPWSFKKIANFARFTLLAAERIQPAGRWRQRRVRQHHILFGPSVCGFSLFIYLGSPCAALRRTIVSLLRPAMPFE
jgi:hypothetical protein